MEGADSAGLATFHPLGDRLTRIELTVDVQPEDLGELACLMLHIADRRVEEQLRRFKADAELLNPDIYEELLEGDNEDADHEEGDSEDADDDEDEGGETGDEGGDADENDESAGEEEPR